MVVIGGIIGSGIFINPYIVAQRLDSGVLVLLAWAAGGATALAGAFAYAELGALFRNKTKVNQKRELVVLIKPTIVDSANNWSQDLLDTSRRIEALDPRTLERK